MIYNVHLPYTYLPEEFQVCGTRWAQECLVPMTFCKSIKAFAAHKPHQVSLAQDVKPNVHGLQVGWMVLQVQTQEDAQWSSHMHLWSTAGCLDPLAWLSHVSGWRL